MNITEKDRLHPVGYLHLYEMLDLKVVEHYRKSYTTRAVVNRKMVTGDTFEEYFPERLYPGNSILNHLEFALKYDGVNFGYLKQIFFHIAEEDLVEYINARPISKHTRRVWFFYEFLTGNKLPIKDLSRGNYVEALDSGKHYAATPGVRVKRQRIVNNLLGDVRFCPLVRRTEKLSEYEKIDLHERCLEVTGAYPEELLRRALSYLYSKETKSSFEIEHIKPNAARTERFVSLLKTAGLQDFMNKASLIDLQNRIVDSRFKDQDYRGDQNYVGETLSFQEEIVHFVPPKPGDLSALMDGLIESHGIMKRGGISPVIHAASISYGFVFLHPFIDGNGRIHRFLLHNILSLGGVVPAGLIFPVSAVMLKNPRNYDSSLEAFSGRLTGLIDYELDQAGHMTVDNQTMDLYRFIDMTVQAEALYEFVIQTIEKEFKEELDFIQRYDLIKKSIQEIIDMPDRLVDLFIHLCLQNNGTLSTRKRGAHFDFLSDEELAAMEKAFS